MTEAIDLMLSVRMSLLSNYFRRRERVRKTSGTLSLIAPLHHCTDFDWPFPHPTHQGPQWLPHFTPTFVRPTLHYMKIAGVLAAWYNQFLWKSAPHHTGKMSIITHETFTLDAYPRMHSTYLSGNRLYSLIWV